MIDAVPRPLASVERAREPRPVAVLYSSADCWRGAGVSFVHIAAGLDRFGIEPRVFALDPDVAAEFRAAGLDATLGERGTGEAARLNTFMLRTGAGAVLVDRAHDVRVAGRAVLGTAVGIVSRYNEFRPSPPRDLMVRFAYRFGVRELVFLTTLARDRVLVEAPFMERPHVATIPEGVDTTEFRRSALAGRRFMQTFGLESPFILAVGALQPEKRYDALLWTLRGLGPAAPTLVICGEGPERPRLQAIVDGWSLDVRFLGRLPRATLVGAYNACAALVHAGDVETFGLAVLEAMACARPVIASASGALPEVVGPDGLCGVLVPPDSTDAMSVAIREVLGDRAAADEMGQRARLRAERWFSIESMERAYAEVVRRAMLRDRSR